MQIDLRKPEVRKQIFSYLHKIENSFLKISRSFDVYYDTLEMVSKLENDSYKLPVVFHSVLLPALKKISACLNDLSQNSICHLDLHSENIIKDDQQYWIIDWEYAAMGHPYITLASMASIERWDDNEMIRMLQDYKNSISLEDFYILYLYRIGIDIFWYVLNQSQQLYSPIEKPHGTWKESYFNSSLKRINSKTYKAAIEHMENISMFYWKISKRNTPQKNAYNSF